MRRSIKDLPDNYIKICWHPFRLINSQYNELIAINTLWSQLILALHLLVTAINKHSLVLLDPMKQRDTWPRMERMSNLKWWQRWNQLQGVSKKRYFLGFLSYFSSGGRILLFCMCFGIRILLLVMNYIHLYHLPPSCWINHHNTNYATSSLTCSQQRRHSFTL